jgi:hypothetical protein
VSVKYTIENCSDYTACNGRRYKWPSLSSYTNASLYKILWLCKSCRSKYFGWILLHTLFHVTNLIWSVMHLYDDEVSESIWSRNFDPSKEVGLEVNTEKTKYMLLPHHQNSWQNHDIKITNRSFKNVAQFRYLGTTVTNQNLVQEEIIVNYKEFSTHHYPELHSYKCLLLYSSCNFNILFRLDVC